jgi:hypothetical protein
MNKAQFEYKYFRFQIEISKHKLFSQLALTILESNQDALLACKDEGEAMQLLTHYLQGVTNDELSDDILLQHKEMDDIAKVSSTVFIAIEKYIFAILFCRAYQFRISFTIHMLVMEV